MSRTRSALAAVATVLLSTTTALAQASGLPGNASNLRESHGDWEVVCSAAEQAVQCVMLQTQVRSENGQRVLSMELTRGGNDAATRGALVLPFGLDLASGVSYRLDEESTGTVQPFRTCLPVGCVVDVAFDAETVAALRAGSALDVVTALDGGQETVFTISLQGFAGAHDRIAELLGADGG